MQKLKETTSQVIALVGVITYISQIQARCVITSAKPLGRQYKRSCVEEWVCVPKTEERKNERKKDVLKHR